MHFVDRPASSESSSPEENSAEENELVNPPEDMTSLASFKEPKAEASKVKKNEEDNGEALDDDIQITELGPNDETLIDSHQLNVPGEDSTLRKKRKFLTDLRTIRESPEIVYTVTFVDAMERHEELPIPQVAPAVENASKVVIEEIFIGAEDDSNQPEDMQQKDCPLIKEEDPADESRDATVQEPDPGTDIIDQPAHHPDASTDDIIPDTEMDEVMEKGGQVGETENVNDLKILNARADKLSEELKLLNKAAAAEESTKPEDEVEEQAADFKEIMRQYSDFIIIVRSDEAGNEETIDHTDLEALDVPTDIIVTPSEIVDVKDSPEAPEGTDPDISKTDEGVTNDASEKIDDGDVPSSEFASACVPTVENELNELSNAEDAPNNAPELKDQSQDVDDNETVLEPDQSVIEKEVVEIENADSGAYTSSKDADKSNAAGDASVEETHISKSAEDNCQTMAPSQMPADKTVPPSDKAERKLMENTITTMASDNSSDGSIFARCKPENTSPSVVPAQKSDGKKDDCLPPKAETRAEDIAIAEESVNLSTPSSTKENKITKEEQDALDNEINEALQAIKNFKPKRPRTDSAQFPDLEVAVEKSIRSRNYGALNYWRMPFRHNLFQEEISQWYVRVSYLVGIKLLNNYLM